MTQDNELLIVAPALEEGGRLAGVLRRTAGENCQWVFAARDFAPRAGQRALFALELDETGTNPEAYALLARLRGRERLLEGCTGALIVDGKTELYTKSAARQLALAANRAGCALVGGPLVEATGSLENFRVRARSGGVSLQTAYDEAAAALAARLREFAPPKKKRPRLLVLHASNSATSNTMALWQQVAARLPDMEVTEIGLRNGVLVDCSGCPYTMCLHFGEKGECFYGGVMVDQVYPALRQADAVLFVCPNYNDALSANLSACINRLTALFRNMRFYDKALYGIVVSGYSGGDLVAEQLLGALSMNKTFYLPPRFVMLETANDAGAAMQLPGIDARLNAFAAALRKDLIGT